LYGRDWGSDLFLYDEKRLPGGPEFARGETDRIGAVMQDLYSNQQHVSENQMSPYAGWWIPRCDMFLDDIETLRINVDLPGVPSNNVRLIVAEDYVKVSSISPHKPVNKEYYYLQSERTPGKFYRRIQLPELIDTEKTIAVMNEGVLQIAMPIFQGLQGGKRRITIDIPTSYNTEVQEKEHLGEQGPDVNLLQPQRRHTHIHIQDFNPETTAISESMIGPTGVVGRP